jgi:hypothetical protein
VSSAVLSAVSVSVSVGPRIAPVTLLP